MRLSPLALGAMFLFCLPHKAFAAAASDSGDTAWILTATALVLMMTLPGLALFYAGLVQAKNVVSVLMHHFAVACLMSILWVVAGYSLAFSGDGPGLAISAICFCPSWILTVSLAAFQSPFSPPSR